MQPVYLFVEKGSPVVVWEDEVPRYMGRWPMIGKHTDHRCFRNAEAERKAIQQLEATG